MTIGGLKGIILIYCYCPQRSDSHYVAMVMLRIWNRRHTFLCIPSAPTMYMQWSAYGTISSLVCAYIVTMQWLTVEQSVGKIDLISIFLVTSLLSHHHVAPIHYHSRWRALQKHVIALNWIEPCNSIKTLVRFLEINLNGIDRKSIRYSIKRVGTFPRF